MLPPCVWLCTVALLTATVVEADSPSDATTWNDFRHKEHWRRAQGTRNADGGNDEESSVESSVLTVIALICVVSGIVATAACLQHGRRLSLPRNIDIARRVEVQVTSDEPKGVGECSDGIIFYDVPTSCERPASASAQFASSLSTRVRPSFSRGSSRPSSAPAPTVRPNSASSTSDTPDACYARGANRPTSASSSSYPSTKASNSRPGTAQSWTRPSSSWSKLSRADTEASAKSVSGQATSTSRCQPPEAWAESAAAWKGPQNPRGEPPSLKAERSSWIPKWLGRRHVPPESQAWPPVPEKEAPPRKVCRCCRRGTRVRSLQRPPASPTRAVEPESVSQLWVPWKRRSKSAPAGLRGSWTGRAKKQTRDASTLVADMLRELEQTRGEPLATRKGVFRELQRQLHPDKNVECEEAAKLAFQELMQQRATYLDPQESA